MYKLIALLLFVTIPAAISTINCYKCSGTVEECKFAESVHCSGENMGCSVEIFNGTNGVTMYKDCTNEYLSCFNCLESGMRCKTRYNTIKCICGSSDMCNTDALIPQSYWSLLNSKSIQPASFEIHSDLIRNGSTSADSTFKTMFDIPK
ncbi:hypothetical protein M3Y97_00931100 [Aphelenchoides bicaudatus]|nr:hypothetical protein M3Y97_00931100 [Aphelenchoides bicaudatus]